MKKYICVSLDLKITRFQFAMNTKILERILSTSEGVHERDNALIVELPDDWMRHYDGVSGRLNVTIDGSHSSTFFRVLEGIEREGQGLRRRQQFHLNNWIIHVVEVMPLPSILAELIMGFCDG